MENREAIEWLKGSVVSYEVDNKGRPNGNVTCDLTQEVIDLAISALEKQANAQIIDSTHASHPNALDSLNILEQAKDDRGCVPMSLVRKAFRNVLEQDRWIPCDERLPDEADEVLVTDGDGEIRHAVYCHVCKKDVFITYEESMTIHEVIAWKPLPEPYTEEEA